MTLPGTDATKGANPAELAVVGQARVHPALLRRSLAMAQRLSGYSRAAEGWSEAGHRGRAKRFGRTFRRALPRFRSPSPTLVVDEPIVGVGIDRRGPPPTALVGG